MGHLNPEAHWDHIGALDVDRVEVHSKGWTLPSSHLMLYESPQDAALRILEEQLGMQDRVQLCEPIVVSEVGTPRRFPDLPKHWDFQFIFRGKMTSGSSLKHDAWRELRFIDTAQTNRREIARSHDEILENSGFSFSGLGRPS